jgi:pimeloyl-ACP methyl ester carboxylesterase
VLFAPIVARTAAATPAAGTPLPSHFPLSLLAQYRRFIEDVPRGQAQVLEEAHFLAWGSAFLATDPDGARRTPPSVNTPSGPVADIGALWSGRALYDPSLVHAPVLLVHGEWDSLCTGADAKRLLAGLESADKSGVTIERGTHLMHLESQRLELHRTVNVFLERWMK